MAYIPISPDQYEQALVPVFGPTIAYEVADQVRWLVAQPHHAVDMAAIAEALSVKLTSLDEWIRKQDWTVSA